MAVTTFKWSIEQWHQLVETGVLADKNLELIEGEIVEMSPEGISHSYSNRSISDYLRQIYTNIAYISERYPITLDNSEPQPDIAVVRLPQDIYRQHHPYPEDIYLLIEISNSTLEYDKDIKAKIYARNQIREYWLIDLVNKKMIVHTLPRDNRYQQIEEINAGVIASQAFPEIKIELSRLLF